MSWAPICRGPSLGQASSTRVLETRAWLLETRAPCTPVWACTPMHICVAQQVNSPSEAPPDQHPSSTTRPATPREQAAGGGHRRLAAMVCRCLLWCVVCLAPFVCRCLLWCLYRVSIVSLSCVLVLSCVSAAMVSLPVSTSLLLASSRPAPLANSRAEEEERGAWC